MRIAQIIDELRPSGGAERLQTSFAEAVRDRDVELTVVTLHRNDEASVRALEAAGARVVRFESKRFLSPGRAARLLRFLREGRFDVVHTHLVRSTLLGCWAARRAGLPVVATLHNTRRRVGRSGVLLALEGLALRRWADRVVAVGWETARVHARRLGGREIVVVPNAVGDPPPLAPAERAAVRAELGVPGEAPLLIAVGRLNPQKGFADLLAAFADVVAAHPDARLCIAGNGQLRGALEAEIVTRGLGRSVRLLGLRRDVPRLLGAADVYASAAHWEGLPVATLEAMAAGLPVVATRVGDVPRVVGEGMGTLVDPGDPAALGRALIALLDEPARGPREGAAGRAHVRARFGRAAWATRLLELYGELGAGEAGGPDAPGEEHRCAS